MSLTRRSLLRTAGIVGVGFSGLHSLLSEGTDTAPDPNWSAEGYGELIRDQDGVLDLPLGFGYRVLSKTGQLMNDGYRVPGAHDGMAAFPGPDGKTIIVRNHELRPDQVKRGPFGKRNKNLGRVAPEAFYDRGNGEAPCLGGTTTLVYDTAKRQLESHHLSLVGTIRNCAGGPTPWGSWISCEETTQPKEGPYEADHGYNFEVPSKGSGLAAPIPLEEMGRFNHEAIAVHEAGGVVYETEDRGDGLLYRFIPNEKQNLAKGGRLQALAIADQPRLDTRNWREPALKQGESAAVRWIDLEDPRSPKDDLRKQGSSKGAAIFARGEGIWTDGDDIYFACTDGGEAKSGQIFKYTASSAEGTAAEGRALGKLQLFLESPGKRILEYADNLTIAPWGDIIICGDGDGIDYVVGITPEAKAYQLARNAMNDSEFCGATFSPDGSTLFVNIQNPGLTLAIAGPWSRRAT